MVQKNFKVCEAVAGSSEEEFRDELLHINQKSFNT